MKDVSVMIDNVKFNYRVGIIIECDNEILVEVNPSIDFVTLPGGRVKTMESSKEGIRREINEELHYLLEDEEYSLRGIIENFFEYENKKYHELYFLYKMKINDKHEFYKEKLINKDNTEHYFKWVKKNDLADVNLLPKILIKWVKTDGFDTTVLH